VSEELCVGCLYVLITERLGFFGIFYFSKYIITVIVNLFIELIVYTAHVAI